MPKLAGGKFKSSHTTAIELAGIMAKFAEQLPGVSGVTFGLIENQIGRSGTDWIVKITDGKECIKLLLLQKATRQEIKVYTMHGQCQAVIEALARYTRDNRYTLKFGKRER